MALWWQWLVNQKVAHRIDDRLVLIGDHTQTPKDGRQIPAVITWHQNSETGSKPSFFRGHHWGGIALLVPAGDKDFATPLWATIPEGLALFTQPGDSKPLPKTVQVVEMAQQVARAMRTPACRGDTLSQQKLVTSGCQGAFVLIKVKIHKIIYFSRLQTERLAGGLKREAIVENGCEGAYHSRDD